MLQSEATDGNNANDPGRSPDKKKRTVMHSGDSRGFFYLSHVTISHVLRKRVRFVSSRHNDPITPYLENEEGHRDDEKQSREDHRPALAMTIAE